MKQVIWIYQLKLFTIMMLLLDKMVTRLIKKISCSLTNGENLIINAIYATWVMVQFTGNISEKQKYIIINSNCT